MHRMNMNKEIDKFHIYYVKDGRLYECHFISSIEDYDHYSMQLHHFVPYTDWEKNTKNVQGLTDNKLILMPTTMHQHLENPLYKLSIEDFIRVYGIHPNKLLFDINSRNPEMQKPWHYANPLEDEDLCSCFDELYKEAC